MTQYVIYIPGLGDNLAIGQKIAVFIWRLWRVHPVVFQMHWADGEPFAAKLQRLQQRIDELARSGSVSLVGASAGAGAAINAFASRKTSIRGVVCICGKVNSPNGIRDSYRQKTPAFYDSAMAVQTSLDMLDFQRDRPKIQSRYAIRDAIVPRADSVVAGGKNKTVAGIGHAFTIGTQLIFGAPAFIRFLKMLKS